MDKHEQITAELIKAYWMELETVQNYLANSVDLDGIRAEEVKKALAADIQTELTHAQLLAKRVRVLGGRVPGSSEFKATQFMMQPPSEQTDVMAVIRGVIKAEEEAINQYNKIIRMCEGEDYATQDLAIDLLGDEESHRREFVGFMREYDR